MLGESNVENQHEFILFLCLYFQDLLSLIDGVWSTHYDVCSVCVSWNIFSSPEDAVVVLQAYKKLEKPYYLMCPMIIID